MHQVAITGVPVGDRPTTSVQPVQCGDGVLVRQPGGAQQRVVVGGRGDRHRLQQLPRRLGQRCDQGPSCCCTSTGRGSGPWLSSPDPSGVLPLADPAGGLGPAPGKTLADVKHALLAPPGSAPAGPPPYRLYGGVAALPPGGQQVTTLHLPRGKYLLVCFIQDPKTHVPHVAMGMIATITVP